MLKLLRYVVSDILRTRFILVYTAFLALSCVGLYQLDSDPTRVVLSLINVLLLVTPLVSVVFSSVYFYDSYEFISLILTQPIRRAAVFASLFLALGISLSVAFLVGIGLPMLLYGGGAGSVALLLCGTVLTWVFVAMSMLASVVVRDKARAIGVALIFWFYFALIYDAFVLWVLYTFSEFPLEYPTLAMMALNPVDLTRILMMMQLDAAALLGYTGAFFNDFFTQTTGIAFAAATLGIWVLLPALLAGSIFGKKDL